MASDSKPASGPLPPQRNPLTKLAVLLGSVFGVICLACCIGSWFFGQQSKNEVVKDPESVKAVAAAIVKIDVPDDYRPSRGQTIHTMFEDIQAAVWESEEGGVILVGKLSDPFDTMTSDLDKSLEQIPLQEMLNRHPYFSGASGTSVEVEIHGEKIAFDILDCSMWGTPGVHETSGVFPTSDGKTGVLYFRTESLAGTSQKQVETLLHSIQ